MFISVSFMTARNQTKNQDDPLPKFGYRIYYTMESYSACKNNATMNFAGKWICLDIIQSEVSQSQKNMHICTHLQMNNNLNVQDIHTTFLDCEQTEQEGRLAGLIDDSAVKSTDFSCEGHEFKSQKAQAGSQPPIMRSDAHLWSV